MEEKLFKLQFITTFLASYAATNYDDCCARGKHETLYNLPVEDAEDIAHNAWLKYSRQI